MTAFFYDSWLTILKFLIPGIFSGVVYDIFRLSRIARNDKTFSVHISIKSRFFPNHFNHKKQKKRISESALIFIEDILFFIIAAIAEILATFQLNSGEIRIYSLCISVIGFFMYQKTLGKSVIFFSRKILYLIRRIVYLIFCAIWMPVFFIFKMTKKAFGVMYSKRNFQQIQK